jgi:thiamine biosynthesis lipoprotein
MTSVAEVARRLSLHRRATFGLLCCFCLLLLAGCERSRDAIHFSGSAQGTTYNITVVPGEGTVDAQALQGLVEARLAQIDQALSNYRDDSEIAGLNRRPAGEWVEIGTDLYEVLMLSMQMSWLSNGAFDVTIGSLVELWGFGGAEARSDVPGDGEIAAARAQAGFQHLELDLGEQRVRKQRPVRIDLSGVAQGYSVDVLADLLRAEGFTDFLVEVGGELVLSGDSPRGTPWRIAIERPSAAGEVELAVELSGMAVSTSGDYRDYFEKDGVRYSHTIDPTSGRPVAHQLASVTVIADSCGQADALSTAIMVLGPDRGLQMAEQHGLAAYLIVRGDKGFETRHSKAFEPYLKSAKPTGV